MIMKKILMGRNQHGIRDLKQAFSQKGITKNANELLDFARHWYLEGKICISDYRTLIKELEINGATKPTTMTKHKNNKRALLLLFIAQLYFAKYTKWLGVFQESFTFTFIYKALQHIRL